MKYNKCFGVPEIVCIYKMQQREIILKYVILDSEVLSIMFFREVGTINSWSWESEISKFYEQDLGIDKTGIQELVVGNHELGLKI